MSLLKPVRVKVEEIGSGLFRATSIDVPGLYVVASEKAAVLQDARKGIQILLELDAYSVAVGEAEELVPDTYLFRVVVEHGSELRKKAC